MVAYRLLTLTYCTACAPYLANKGPPLLKLHSTKWPDHRFNSSKTSDLEPRVQECHQVLSEIKGPFDLMFKFSSWPKLLRVTAYCKRFVDAFHFKYSKCLQSKPQCLPPSPSTLEIQKAGIFWIKYVQVSSFSLELQALRQNEGIAQNSPLENVNPFFDAIKLLRLRARSRHAHISFDEKHPIILPQHPLSNMLDVYAHIRSLHGGLQLTLHKLRQRFCILRAHPLVEGLIKDCFEYARERTTLSQELMGALPDFRVTPNRLFTHTG
ncbi:uncharacterized protein LOC117175517 [Belonocnema kinseyi]|uniref:uncharacterized protein LOC117175517 n=1 Tax=Belonocnema kinseyi TaxID=2817044 RepID=UPI00143DE669|nr:uncharacterized protein LOC117175517 [Belonocnema kinseyi]